MSQQSSAQRAFVTSYSPEPEDTSPSDLQPPRVDEENEIERDVTELESHSY